MESSSELPLEQNPGTFHTKTARIRGSGLSLERPHSISSGRLGPANLIPLFTSGIVGVFVVEHAEKITEANETFLRLLGFTHTDLPLDWNLLTSGERGSLSQGEKRVRQVEFSAKNGSVVPVLVEMMPQTGNGDVLIGIALDRTGQRQVERQLNQRQVQLQALTAALLQADEQERRRIGQGLHDHIGQILALAKGKLSVLSSVEMDADARQPLEDIQTLINQAIQSIRSLTFELSTPVLYELGLDAALQSLGEQLSQEHGLHFDLKYDKCAKPLDDPTRFMLYGFARELLFNIVKHAHANNVSLKVDRLGVQLRLTVADDGIGFDATDAGEVFDEQTGFGLFSIRQQLNYIGGSLEIETSTGDGARLSVVVPLAYGTFQEPEG